MVNHDLAGTNGYPIYPINGLYCISKNQESAQEFLGQPNRSFFHQDSATHSAEWARGKGAAFESLLLYWMQMQTLFLWCTFGIACRIPPSLKNCTIGEYWLNLKGLQRCPVNCATDNRSTHCCRKSPCCARRQTSMTISQQQRYVGSRWCVLHGPMIMMMVMVIREAISETKADQSHGNRKWGEYSWYSLLFAKVSYYHIVPLLRIGRFFH